MTIAKILITYIGTDKLSTLGITGFPNNAIFFLLQVPLWHLVALDLKVFLSQSGLHQDVDAIERY